MSKIVRDQCYFPKGVHFLPISLCSGSHLAMERPSTSLFCLKQVCISFSTKAIEITKTKNIFRTFSLCLINGATMTHKFSLRSNGDSLETIYLLNSIPKFILRQKQCNSKSSMTSLNMFQRTNTPENK